MKKVLNEKKYLCRVASTGFIPELGCVTGPINRCKLSERLIFQLVKNKKIVYEINPFNPKEEVLLTTENMATRHFVKPQENPIKVEAEVIEEPFVNEAETVKDEEPAEIPVESEQIETVDTEVSEDTNESNEISVEVTEESSENIDDTEENDVSEIVEDTVVDQVSEEKNNHQYQIRNGKHNKNKNRNR